MITKQSIDRLKHEEAPNGHRRSCMGAAETGLSRQNVNFPVPVSNTSSTEPVLVDLAEQSIEAQ